MRLVIPTRPEPASKVRLPPRSLCRRFLACTCAWLGVAAREASGIRVFPMRVIQQPILEQSEVHDRKQCRSAGSREVIEGLLLEPDRETHRIGHRNFADTVP